MKKLWLVGLATLAVVLVLRGERRDPDAARGELRGVVGRLWVERWPKDDVDRIHRMFLGVAGRPIGSIANASNWSGEWQAFRFEVAGDDGRLSFYFPQSRTRRAVTLRSSRCNENGFDYCLEVTGAGVGPTRYFSKEAWKLDASEATDATVAALARIPPPN